MELKKARREFCFMAVLLVLSILFYTVVIPAQIPLRSTWGADIAFTSRTYPSLLAVALMVMSVIGIADAVRKILALKRQAAEQPAEESAKEPLVKTLIPYAVFGLILLYGVLFVKIGYIWATLLVPPALLAVMGCRKWTYYLYVYGFAAIVYVLFRFVLQVVLP